MIVSASPMSHPFVCCCCCCCCCCSSSSSASASAAAAAAEVRVCLSTEFDCPEVTLCG